MGLIRHAMTVVAVIGFASAAFAADMAVKAPPPPPPPVASWTGLYVGLNGGYGWNQSTGNQNCITPTGVLFGPGCWTSNGGITQPNGGLFGGQVGYNLQINSIVYGLESDIQLSGITNPGSTTNICCVPAFTSAVGTVTASANLDWFGTVRARAGFLVTPNVLLYGTGGLIYGHESMTSVEVFPLINYTAAGSFTRAGGTAGGGVEYAFTRNFTGKIEGLWYELGSADIAGTSPITKYTLATNYRLEGGIVRGGLNWKFGMW